MPPPSRHALITVGATAPFPALIAACTQPAVLHDLALRRGITHLHIQTGQPASPSPPAWLGEMLRHTAAAEQDLGLSVRVFAHRPSLDEEMRLCLPSHDEDDDDNNDNDDDGDSSGATPPRRRRGLMLTHAGTGSVLEALRLGVPFVAYANPSLMHNHQAELAAEMDRRGVGVRGDLG
jgi:beta-1,4-N-acetylglucosaminyltransferase